MTHVSNTQTAEMLLDFADVTRPEVEVSWSVPAQVALRDDRLTIIEYSPSRLTRPSPSLIQDFIELDTPSHVLRFASRWGLLGLCEHGGPASAHEHVMASPARWQCPELDEEPVDEWLKWAVSARAIVGAISNLTALRRVDRKYLDVIAPNGPPIHVNGPDGLIKVTPVQAEQSVVTRVINRWVRLAGLRPNLTWLDSERPQFRYATYGGTTLFGALGMQLLAGASGQNTHYQCDACGLAFTVLNRERKPKANLRTYCTDCRRSGNANRHSQRMSRRERRAKGKARTR